jgi:hypothetical protein
MRCSEALARGQGHRPPSAAALLWRRHRRVAWPPSLSMGRKAHLVTMSSIATEDEVVQRVLETFQHELRGLRGGWFSRMFMGDAPTEGYARRLSELDVRGHMTGSVLGVWRITHTEIAALPLSFIVPAPAGLNGMYYNRGSFDFVIAPDGTSIVAGCQVGPRFGSGVRYQVVTNDSGQLSLKLADTLWRS